MNKSKNTVKNRWDYVETFMCACVCVCVWGYCCVLLSVDEKVVFTVCVCEDVYAAR